MRSKQWPIEDFIERANICFCCLFYYTNFYFRSRDTPVHSTVQSDRLSHIWCKDYAKLRNISFRSISSRFAPFRSANYRKPRVITIHEVWKGGGGGGFMEHMEETVVNLSNGPQVIYEHLFTFT